MRPVRVIGLLALIGLCTLTPLRSGESGACTIDLSRYVAAGPVARIKGIPDNLSGITWSVPTRRLVCVLNNPTRLLVLAPDGAIAQTVALTGFHDTEAIAHIGGNRFWVLEEQNGRVIRIELGPDVTEIKLDPSSLCTWVLDHIGHNKGLEALAVGRTGREIFAFKERDVRRAYHAWLPACDGEPPPKTREVVFDIPWNAESPAWTRLGDLAGAHFDRRTGHLLVLSEQSKRIAECTRQGHIVSTFELGTLMKQPEGITMDDAGAIYVCGEPDELLKLVPAR